MTNQNGSSPVSGKRYLLMEAEVRIAFVEGGLSEQFTLENNLKINTNDENCAYVGEQVYMGALASLRKKLLDAIELVDQEIAHHEQLAREAGEDG